LANLAGEVKVLGGIKKEEEERRRLALRYKGEGAAYG
jgi:hypothetical protein